MENQKIKSIFLGQVRRKIYSDWFCVNDGVPKESSEFVEYKKLHECELSRPQLEEKEKIYVPELDATLQVSNVIKSTDGSITYQTCYTMKIIEDEQTLDSYEKALKKIEEYKKEEQNKLQKEKEKKEKQEQNNYIEKDGISRCICSNKEEGQIIIHKDLDKSIRIINTKSGNTIQLSPYAQDNLIKFLRYIEFNIN